MSFCAEFVSLFELCAMYFEQAHQGSISYSTLFGFTDPSTFSKLASVSKDAEVPTAIIELKSKYFQIQRHVEEASRFALEGSRASDKNQKQDRMDEARQAQGTALAFFFSEYQETERMTELLIKTAKQVSPGPTVWNLESRFSEARRKIHNLKKETPNPESKLQS